MYNTGKQVTTSTSAYRHSFPFDRSWQLPQAIELACLLEASAPKAGNVHPQAAFHDMHFGHFLASAVAVREAFEQPVQHSVGQMVLAAVRKTRAAAECNTNLGAVLLVAPIAKAHTLPNSPRESLQYVLDSLTSQDCQLVYEAIRIAQPGGLVARNKDDVCGPAPSNLIAAMSQVADVDAVARQYTNGFADVFDILLPWLDEALVVAPNPLDAICRLQIRWLAQEADGLIVRKLGPQSASEVQDRARDVWQAAQASPGNILRIPAYREFDAFLRKNPSGSHGNLHNPGTTADLITATLLVKLLEASGR